MSHPSYITGRNATLPVSSPSSFSAQMWSEKSGSTSLNKSTPIARYSTDGSTMDHVPTHPGPRPRLQPMSLRRPLVMGAVAAVGLEGELTHREKENEIRDIYHANDDMEEFGDKLSHFRTEALAAHKRTEDALTSTPARESPGALLVAGESESAPDFPSPRSEVRGTLLSSIGSFRGRQSGRSSAKLRSRVRDSGYGTCHVPGLRRGSRAEVVGGEDGTSKKPTEVVFPCPFRRRNPMRFNIRDHEHCAKAQFSSPLDLRHHIVLHHQRQTPCPQCRRCGIEFDSQTGLEQHLMMPKDQICEINPDVHQRSDPEDGIEDDVGKLLWLDTDGSNGLGWESTWRLLFPADQDIPDPDFHPVVELTEVEHALDNSQEALKSCLQDKLRLLLPSTIEDSYCTFLAGQLELVVETHHANVMRKCLTQLVSWPPSTLAMATTNPREALSRRSTRRSRRSTMLQVLRPTSTSTNGEAGPDVFKDGAFTHRRPRLLDRSCPQGDVDRTGGIPDPHSPPHTPHRRASTDELPPTALLHFAPDGEEGESGLPTSATSLTHSEAGRLAAAAELSVDEFVDLPPRDSRDSGIGIPCDICESEACRCREIILSLAAAQGKGYQLVSSNGPAPRTEMRMPSPPPPAPHLPRPSAQDSIPYRSSAGASHNANVATFLATVDVHGAPMATGRRDGPIETRHPSLRHQPRLQLRTAGIAHMHRAEETDNNGGFSPQSFKQRVLRTQGHGDADGGRRSCEWT